jgi:hypothetical protein
MREYITFETDPTEVQLSGICGKFGTANGYKLTAVLHGGRVISLKPMNYFYIPLIHKVVSHKATRSTEMKVNENGMFNFQEKYTDRKGGWSFKADARTIYDIAFRTFKG